MNVNTKNNDFIQYLFLFFISCFLICVFTPYLKSNLNSFIVGSLFVISFFLSFFLQKGIKFSCIELFAIVSSTIILVYWFLGFSTCSVGKMLNHVMIMLSLILIRNAYHSSYYIKKIITFVITITITYNIIDNIRLNVIYPNASENINFSWGEDLLRKNVGGSVFTFLVSAISVLSFYIILKNKKKRMFWGVLLIVSVIYVIMTSRALSILTMITGMSFVLILNLIKHNSSNKKKLILFSIILILLILLFIVGPTVLEMISKITNTRISARLKDMASILRFQISNRKMDSGSVRLELYLMSIKTLFRSTAHFLFGIGEHPANVALLNSIGVGAHSAFFDLYAEYGVVWSTLIMLSHVFIAHNFISNSFEANKNILILLVTLFFINTFLNNVVTLECVYLFYLYLPFLFSVLEQNRGKNYVTEI